MAARQPIADWASLSGDLARPSHSVDDPVAPVDFRIHDRTHLEFAIDYPIRDKVCVHTWEAFFFVPESFRLHESSYDKKAIYDDLWSYVRYAVPPIPFSRLTSTEPASHIAQLTDALTACAHKLDGSSESAEAMLRLRVFACMVRASGLTARREVLRGLDDEGLLRAHVAVELAASFAKTASAITKNFRAAVRRADPLHLPNEVLIAARWIDEDISLVLETLSATLSISLEERSLSEPKMVKIASDLAEFAVNEARHRRERGYTSVGSAMASKRKVEHLEFRRHLLKRFTASALWLSLNVRTVGSWVTQTLYALAAAVAMAFALIASLKATASSDNFFRYATLVILAYAAKDRMKALLQRVLVRWIERQFPDRKWLIRDWERRRTIGEVHERAGFLPYRRLPAEVLAVRRLTRLHRLEEHARPERVLWHKKMIMVPALNGDSSAKFSMITEIFRLSLDRWLAHTDDPNRNIVFADPEDARVYTATTRRVYNINVIYRLQTGGKDAWHRLRVVVSRRGIERIEPIC